MTRRPEPTATEDTGLASDAVPPRPHLFRVIDGARPLDPPSRHALDGLATVTIGRGVRAADRTNRTLRLSEPDVRISAEHARLTRDPGGWVLADLGSKNGTWLNGAPVRTALLADGDLIEVGRACFLFRAAMAAAAGTPPDAIGVEPGLPDDLATMSPSFAADLRALATVARSGVAVLLLGETGTGKEVVARAVHALSRRAGPFVAVNCGGIPASLVETELFGVRRGAYSDAKEDRPGLVRTSDGGSLFLDEVGDLPLGAQASLLRVLQEREVVPVGHARPVRVDLRLLSATHRPLESLVAAGKFREDLWARLAGFTMGLPPLRARREDLGLIIAALVRRYAGDSEKIAFHPEAMRALLLSPWPRNVRELEKRLEAALVLAGDRLVERRHLGELGEPAVPTVRSPAEPAQAAPDPRRLELERLLGEHNGNVTAVARALRKDRVQIRRWLARYGIDATAFKRSPG